MVFEVVRGDSLDTAADPAAADSTAAP